MKFFRGIRGRKKEKAADLFIELGKFIGAGFAIERLVRGLGEYGVWVAVLAALFFVGVGIAMTENEKEEVK